MSYFTSNFRILKIQLSAIKRNVDQSVWYFAYIKSNFSGEFGQHHVSCYCR